LVFGDLLGLPEAWSLTREKDIAWHLDKTPHGFVFENIAHETVPSAEYSSGDKVACVPAATDHCEKNGTPFSQWSVDITEIAPRCFGTATYHCEKNARVPLA
jgi:hypothetical protein